VQLFIWDFKVLHPLIYMLVVDDDDMTANLFTRGDEKASPLKITLTCVCKCSALIK